MKTFSKEDKEMDAYKQKMEKVLSLAMTESMARGVFFGLVMFLNFYKEIFKYLYLYLYRFNEM